MVEEELETKEHLFRVSQTIKDEDASVWLIDSGCTSHMSKNLSHFASVDKTDKPMVKLGNGKTVQERAEVQFCCIQTKLQSLFKIFSTYLTLIKIVKYGTNGYTMSFKNDLCHITDTSGT